MKVNSEALQYLRDRERKDLLIIERIILKLKLRYMRTNDILSEYKRVEKYQGPDLNNTDYYEYNVRYKAFQSGLEKLYFERGENVGLDPFTDRIISENMRDKKELKLRRG